MCVGGGGRVYECTNVCECVCEGECVGMALCTKSWLTRSYSLSRKFNWPV